MTDPEYIDLQQAVIAFLTAKREAEADELYSLNEGIHHIAINKACNKLEEICGHE